MSYAAFFRCKLKTFSNFDVKMLKVSLYLHYYSSIHRFE